MKFLKNIPVLKLAEMTGAALVGNHELEATGINELHKVMPGDVCFVDHEKYYEKVLNSAASIIIINKEVECPEGKALLVHENAFEAYDGLVRKFRPMVPISVVIHPDAKIHPSAILEPNVIVGKGCVIGENCHIQANVIIHEFTIIGKNVTIQSGTVIGTDAFYYKRHPDTYQKWRSCGRVVIEDNVEIGACCTINKGVSGDTIIGKGSKLDCQVHIGHGVVLGENCLFAAQVGIGGKTIIGKEVKLLGQVGVAQSISIGDNATVLAKSGVSKPLAGGKVYFGTPAKEARELYRELAALRQLPNLLKTVFKSK